jgi:DNA-binding IclR family transcriptional regulator
VVIFAAPIFDYRNSIVAAINIGIPVQQLHRYKKSQYTRLLQAAVCYISYRMGSGKLSPIQDVTELQKEWL